MDADDPNDGDFQPDDMDMDEDDLKTQLDPQTEQIVASRYGFMTNAVLNEGTDEERQLFFEGPAHHAVAASHDIGIPAESSLVNSENIIGRVEVNRLRQGLEPWEAEAVHLSTGRSYDDLMDTFPEIEEHELPEPAPTTRVSRAYAALSSMVCPHCHKGYTDGLIEWLQIGSMTLCGSCQLFRHPENPADDPDWPTGPFLRNDLLDARTMNERCRCRCHCGWQQTPNDVQIVRGKRVIRAPRSPYADAVPRPQLRHLTDMEIPFKYDWDIEDWYLEREELIVMLKEEFGLPDALFVHEYIDSYANMMLTIDDAVKKGKEAIMAGSWDLAYRYLQVAGQLAKYFCKFKHDNDLMLDIFQNLRRVHRHLQRRRNTSQDTMILGDIHLVLTGNDIEDSDVEGPEWR